jgi:hypothetical protein
MINIGTTRGILHRGTQVVGVVEDLAGSIAPQPGKSLRINLRVRLVGPRGYWCEPGVELEVTWLTRPKRPRGARLYCPQITIVAIDNEAVSLSGTRGLGDPGAAYQGPIPPEVTR